MSEGMRRAFRTRGVEIDRDAGVIRRNNEEYPLRHKSHRLLVHLIDHRAAPVSKEDLIRSVWEGASVSDDTIVNCVQEIRKALGDDARNPVFIRTLPKTGYWFVAPEEDVASREEPVAASGETDAVVLPAPPGATPPALPGGRRAGQWKRWMFVGLASALSAFAGWKILGPAPVPPPNYWEETSWWTFDEGDDVPVPAGTSRVAGVLGGALHFSGSESGPAGKASASMPLGAAPRTVMAWVKTTPNPADTTILFNYGAPSPDTPFDTVMLGIHETGRPGLFTGRSSLLGSSRVDDGHWHHIAAVFAGASRRAVMFVDGVENGAGELAGSSFQIAPVNRWSLGRTIWGSTPFRGDIDDVRVYSRTMGAAEIRALLRCVTAPADLGGDLQFVPVFNTAVRIEPAAMGESSAKVGNTGQDFAGISIARRDAGCAIRSTLAADMGQDLTIEADIRTGGNSTDQITEAGPYLRSRTSAPGDGIIGGTSAGYWVQLRSNGQVRVRRLNPYTTIAFSGPEPGFDANAFHRLSVTARGDALIVTVDGRVMTFDQAGANVTEVRLAPEWEKLAPKGKNRGAAGIAFSAESNRNHATGQQARNIRLVRGQEKVRGGG